MSNSTSLSEPIPIAPKRASLNSQPSRQPRYHVRLWDDNEHTVGYVVRMMRQLFGYDLEKARRIAHEVDSQGSAICLTTTREHAELKRDQIHAFGGDPRVRSCLGAMSSSIEAER